MSQLASADTPRLGERRAQDRLGDDLRPDDMNERLAGPGLRMSLHDFPQAGRNPLCRKAIEQPVVRFFRR
jgi:hypothetical protein